MERDKQTYFQEAETKTRQMERINTKTNLAQMGQVWDPFTTGYLAMRWVLKPP